MLVLPLSQAKELQFCCSPEFPFCLGEDDYQMAHGYFYLLYGKFPTDNYDITATVYVLCYEYLALSLVTTP